MVGYPFWLPIQPFYIWKLLFLMESSLKRKVLQLQTKIRQVYNAFALKSSSFCLIRMKKSIVTIKEGNRAMKEVHIRNRSREKEAGAMTDDERAFKKDTKQMTSIERRRAAATTTKGAMEFQTQ